MKNQVESIRLFLLISFIIMILVGCNSDRSSSQVVQSKVIQDGLEITFRLDQYVYLKDEFNEDDDNLKFSVTIENVDDGATKTLLHSDPLCIFAILDKNGNAVIDRISNDEANVTSLKYGDLLYFKDNFKLNEIQESLDKGEYIALADVRYLDGNFDTGNTIIRMELPFRLQ